MVLNEERTRRGKLEGLRTVQDAKQNLMVSSVCIHFTIDCRKIKYGYCST